MSQESPLICQGLEIPSKNCNFAESVRIVFQPDGIDTCQDTFKREECVSQSLQREQIESIFSSRCNDCVPVVFDARSFATW